MNVILYHGLRNSISGILSASESLIDDFAEAQGDHGDHKVLIRAIHESSRSILRLIDDEFERTGDPNRESALSYKEQSFSLQTAP